MIYKCFLFMLFWCFSLGALADVGISPIVLDLVGNDADAEISVKNFDTKNAAYVEITPYRLTDPANHSAPKKRVLHPDKEGLIAYPAKLMLLPGQTQFIRIIKTAKSLASDQVYEVDVIPKVATHLISQTNADGLMLGVRVIIGYGARVILRPDLPSPTIAVKRARNELIIKNTGNTTLNITSCTQQVSSKKTEIPLPTYTIFVGQTIKKELTQATQVTLNASFMGKSLGPFYTD